MAVTGSTEGHGWLALTENNRLQAWFQLSDQIVPRGSLEQTPIKCSVATAQRRRGLCQRHGFPDKAA